MYIFKGAPVQDNVVNGNFLLCKTCNTFVKQMVGLFEKGLSIEELTDVAVGICKTLHLYEEAFCRGIVETNVVFQNSIDNYDNKYNTDAFIIHSSQLSNISTIIWGSFLEIFVPPYCQR